MDEEVAVILVPMEEMQKLESYLASRPFGEVIQFFQTFGNFKRMTKSQMERGFREQD